jgi:ACS family D-galactonate transporter-like MFS transporter
MRPLISFLSVDLQKDDRKRMESSSMRVDDRNRPWIVVVLLFMFMVINFADKAVIGIAAVPIMRELELGPRQFGLVGSSFFLLFAISSIATGFLVNRVQTRWVLLVMGFIWALTQFPMIGSIGFETLLACRIALGAGEGPAAPVALHSAYKWFPNELRSFPTAVIVQGGAIGVLVALPLLNWVIVRWTWHWAFGSLGLAGLVWCALWLFFGREGSLDDRSTKAKDAAQSSQRVGYAQLLLSPTILACWAASFGANWALSLALSWQGVYLIKGLGLSQSSIGLLGALSAGSSAVVMLATGWYSQRLLSRGVSSRLARGILGGLSVVLGGAALATLPYVPGTLVKIALTTLGVALPSAIYVISNSVVGETTPAAQRGALLAIGTAVASSGGLLAPYVMGSVIESATTPLDGFNTGFFICGVIMLAGGAIAMALVNPERDAKGRSLRLQPLTTSA